MASAYGVGTQIEESKICAEGSSVCAKVKMTEVRVLGTAIFSIVLVSIIATSFLAVFLNP